MSEPIRFSVRFRTGKADASTLQKVFSKQLEGRFARPIPAQTLSLAMKLG